MRYIDREVPVKDDELRDVAQGNRLSAHVRLAFAGLCRID